MVNPTAHTDRIQDKLDQAVKEAQIHTRDAMSSSKPEVAIIFAVLAVACELRALRHRIHLNELR